MESGGGLVPVLVTTSHRGVFFGFVDPELRESRTLQLVRARNCIYWSSSIGGFLGLAKTGPNSDCKIGAEAPELLLHDVTSVSSVTDGARDAWVAA